MVERALRGLVLFFVIALVGCDHATKVVAKITLEGAAPKRIIPGVLDLVYTENRDTAFSLLHGVTNPAKGPLLIVMSSLAIVAITIAWWKRRAAAGWIEHTAFVLILGGAIANVLDRVARGYVVDFIHVARWPVFNVADVAICVGGPLLGLAMRRTKNAAPVRERPPTLEAYTPGAPPSPSRGGGRRGRRDR